MKFHISRGKTKINGGASMVKTTSYVKPVSDNGVVLGTVFKKDENVRIIANKKPEEALYRI
ncbi:MAG: hypothetical protein H6Q74_77 [Firmicutes bacterium]|nr:hypothetical protein [Bacillota bacterium]